jgi:hypothetical protein
MKTHSKCVDVYKFEKILELLFKAQKDSNVKAALKKLVKLTLGAGVIH